MSGGYDDAGDIWCIMCIYRVADGVSQVPATGVEAKISDLHPTHCVGASEELERVHPRSMEGASEPQLLAWMDRIRLALQSLRLSALILLGSIYNSFII